MEPAAAAAALLYHPRRSSSFHLAFPHHCWLPFVLFSRCRRRRLPVSQRDGAFVGLQSKRPLLLDSFVSTQQHSSASASAPYAYPRHLPPLRSLNTVCLLHHVRRGSFCVVVRSKRDGSSRSQTGLLTLKLRILTHTQCPRTNGMLFTGLPTSPLLLRPISSLTSPSGSSVRRDCRPVTRCCRAQAGTCMLYWMADPAASPQASAMLRCPPASPRCRSVSGPL